MLAVIIVKMIIVVVITESPVVSHQPLARSSDLVLAERKEAGGGRPAKSPSFIEKEPKARRRQQLPAWHSG